MPLPPKLLDFFTARGGVVSIADYMDFCLFDCNIGYYTTRTPMVAGNDFITTPELSPLFGYTLAAWVANAWKKLNCPTPFLLLECGGGSGILLHDILTELHKTAPDCAVAAHVYMLEKSPALKIVQQKKLDKYRVHWVENISSLPTLPAVVVGNEFLDCFPIRQFIKQHNGTYHERAVEIQNNTLAFTTLTTPHTFESTAPLIETQEAMIYFLKTLTAHLPQHACLWVDYGAAPPTLFNETDTLQAIKNHTPVDVLAFPTTSDLTTHVNFSAVAQAVGGTQHLTSQAEFLMQHGLASRALAYLPTLTADEHTATEAALHRLLHPAYMGHLFKVFEHYTRA